MFSKRLLTTLVLVPVVVWVVFYTSQFLFQCAVALLLLASAWEWSRLISLIHIFVRICFLMAVVVLFVLMPVNMIMYLLSFTIICWLLIMLAVAFYPQCVGVWSSKSMLTALGIVVFVSFGLSLLWLKSWMQEINLVMYLLLLVWAADTGAYIFGKLWGTRKLVPKLSPGKTIVGVFGGIVSGILVSVIYGMLMNLYSSEWLMWLLIALITILFSIVGDLLISILKRQAGVKDSGKMLPGHGGILDRMDSLLASAPVFTFLIITSGILC